MTWNFSQNIISIAMDGQLVSCYVNYTYTTLTVVNYTYMQQQQQLLMTKTFESLNSLI